MKRNSKMRGAMVSAALLSTIATTGLPAVQGVTASADSHKSVQVDSNSPQAFIASIAPQATKIAASHDMYASVMIAQALVESASGQSTLAQAPNYNLFGIKGTGTAGSVNMGTSEQGKNGLYSTNANFKKYKSFTDSLEDNANVISSNVLYSNAWRSNAKTYQDATAALQGTYATSNTYAQTLNNVIQQYGLTRFDSKHFNSTALAGSTDMSAQELIKSMNIDLGYKTETIKYSTPMLYKTTATDSVWGIAQAYKTTPEALLHWNKDLKGSSIEANTELQVGVTEHKKVRAYKEVKEHDRTKVEVKSGDSLWSIAQAHHITVEKLMELNNIDASNILHVGSKLTVKDKVKTVRKYLSAKEKKALDTKALNEARSLVFLNSVSNNNTNTNAAAELSNVDVTSSQAKVLKEASEQIGKPYVWGAKGPNAFDCSGLVQYVYKQALGVDLTGYTGTQQNQGQKISVADAQPGDLYFWDNGSGTSYHVAIAIGNGKFIAAPRPGENVQIGNISQFTPQYAVRVLGAQK